MGIILCAAAQSTGGLRRPRNSTTVQKRRPAGAGWLRNSITVQKRRTPTRHAGARRPATARKDRRSQITSDDSWHLRGARPTALGIEYPQVIYPAPSAAGGAPISTDGCSTASPANPGPDRDVRCRRHGRRRSHPGRRLTIRSRVARPFDSA
jgi:hypothetical protein